jgi:hypothetical protein
MGVLVGQFEASEKSGSEQAMALLQAAANPEGTRQRIEELTAATAAYEAAAERASKAEAAASTAKAGADAAIAEANRKEAWVADQQRRIKLDGQNIAAHHDEIARQQKDLGALAERLEARKRDQTAFILSVRSFLESADTAAKG